jgi:hypothetical protein
MIRFGCMLALPLYIQVLLDLVISGCLEMT